MWENLFNRLKLSSWIVCLSQILQQCSSINLNFSTIIRDLFQLKHICLIAKHSLLHLLAYKVNIANIFFIFETFSSSFNEKLINCWWFCELSSKAIVDFVFTQLKKNIEESILSILFELFFWRFL